MAVSMYRLVYYSRDHIAHDQALFASNVEEIQLRAG
jgi:hypothetical protein